MKNELNSLGTKIRNLREDNDLTQKDLSTMIGLTPKMISFYENNQRTPPIDILMKLAHIFNVSIGYLVGESQQPNNQLDLPPTPITWNKVQELYPTAKCIDPELQELIDYYEELSLKDKRWIMGQMVDLIKKAEGKNDFSLKE